MPKRTAIMGPVLAALMLLTAVPGRASADHVPGEAHTAYVAAVDAGYVGCIGIAGCPVEPDGSFYVHPTGTSFTLNVDDFGTEDGSAVWVRVLGNGLDFGGCIPVRTPRTFTGQVDGEHVHVEIRATFVPCPATAGSVTVSGVHASTHAHER